MKHGSKCNLPVLLLLFVLCLIGIVSATAPTPTPGTAVVDGKYNEWDISPGSPDFFANMFRAGNSEKELESKAYLRYDCDKDIIYVLVLSESGIPVLASGYEDDAWTKNLAVPGNAYDGNSGNDGTPPDFAWVGLSADGKTAQGYEASFELGPGSYKIVIHVEVFDEGEAQTSATVGFPKDGTDLLLPDNCTMPPPVSVPEFPSLALPVAMMIGIVGLVFVIKSRER